MVRLTKEEMENKRYDRAENRMNSGDGGLARHAVTRKQEIDWEKSKSSKKKKDGHRGNI